MENEIKTRIKIPVQLEILSRIEVLSRLAGEIGKAVGASASDLEIIKIGVLERSIDRVTFLLRGGAGVEPGLVEIEFDWSRNIATLATKKNSNSFTFDPKLELLGQVSRIISRLADEIELRMAEAELTRSEMTIRYSSVEAKELLKKKFDLVPISDEKKTKLDSLRKKSIEVGDARFDEFIVRMKIGEVSS